MVSVFLLHPPSMLSAKELMSLVMVVEQKPTLQLEAFQT